MQGQVQWNRKPNGEGLTTTLTINCRPDGQIHVETPNSSGGFASDYKSAQEAGQDLTRVFEEGITQVSGG